MQPTSNPILFFGTEDFSLISLQALLDSDFVVAGVVTKPDSRKGRGQKLVPPSVKVLAQAHGIPVWQPEKLSDITADIQALGNPVGVLVSYGKIIPQALIALFTPGIINVHPSLLPRYRGPSPIESAIKHGDSQTGVTIMQLEARMDAGPLYAQEALALNGTETRPELYQTLGAQGATLLLASLPGILDGSLTPTPQVESEATYCQLLQKEDALLQPSTQTAAAAERLVRAHLGFPKSKLSIEGHTVIVTAAHVSTQQKTPLDVQFQDGAYLSIDQLVAPSGKAMNAEAFLRGYC